MAQQTATAASVKISKNARAAGIVTQKFTCECGGKIEMFLTLRNRKRRAFARCDKCGKEGRSPNRMAQKIEKLVIEKTIVEEG